MRSATWTVVRETARTVTWPWCVALVGADPTWRDDIGCGVVYAVLSLPTPSAAGRQPAPVTGDT